MMPSPSPNRQTSPKSAVEQAYEWLLSPTPIPTLIIHSGFVAFVNNAAVHVFGASSAEELLDRSVFELIDPEFHERARMRIATALNSGEPQPPTLERFIGRHGRSFDVEVAAWRVPYKTEAALVVTFLDITERKRAEEALRRRETQLQLVIDGVPGLVSYIDREFRYRLVNRGYSEWFERPTSAITDQTVTEVLGQAAAESVRADMERALRGEVVTFERSLAYKGTHVRHIRGTYVPDITPDGTVRGFVVLVQDISEGKKAQEALRESKARFRLMADNAPVLVWMAGPDGAASWFNQPWLEFRGRAMEEELGEGYIEGIHPDDSDRRAITYRTSIDARRPFMLEYRIKRHDGVYRWVLDHGVPLPDSFGEFIGFIGSCVDITERKQAEQQLQTSEKRYRTLFETTREGVLIVDDEGQYIDVNDSFCRLMRTTRDRILGASFVDFIPPGRLEEATIGLAQLKSGGAATADFPLQALDGAIVELEWTSSAQFLPGLSCCVCRDVTERKRAERTLQMREEEARTLLAALPDVVARFDRDLRFVYMSPAVERSTGLPPEHYLGKTHIEAGLPDQLSDQLRASLQRIFDTGLQDVVEFDLMLPKGLRHFVGIGVPEFAVNGEVISALSIVRDITERKRSEEALQAANTLLTKANADLEQFAYSASHDLREPIRMVSLYTQLLKKKYRGRLDLEAEQYIDFAVEGAHRMNRMIDDLLAYTRSSVDSGQPVRSISAAAALENALQSLRPAIEESGATVTFDNLPDVAIHSVQLEQIFQNLIGNAIKYRSQIRPVIHVGVQRNADDIIFSVSDNGIGIDDAYSDHIFGLFKRLHAAGEYPGTGMGLAICRNIVERYSGRIWVRSTPGKGSTFYFAIPDRK